MTRVTVNTPGNMHTALSSILTNDRVIRAVWLPAIILRYGPYKKVEQKHINIKGNARARVHLYGKQC